MDTPQSALTPLTLPWRVAFRLLLHLSSQLREMTRLQRALLEAAGWETTVEETPALEERKLAWWIQQEQDPRHATDAPPETKPLRKLDARDIIRQTADGSVNLGHQQNQSSLLSAARARNHLPVNRR